MKKSITLVALVLVVLFVFASCTTAEPNAAVESSAAEAEVSTEAEVSGESAAPAESVPDEGEQVYYMITFLSGSDYWKGCLEGFEEAAAQDGVTVEYYGTPEYDVNAQITVFEQALAKNPTGIAVCPIQTEAFVDSINKAIEQGVPTVTFSSDSPDSKRLSFICADNLEEGKIGADTLAEALGEKGEIGIVQRPGQNNLDLRVQGFEDRIAEAYPDMKIVARENGEGNQQTAANVTASMLQANPNIKGIFTIAGEEGIGIAAAVAESGLDVKIFAFDADVAVLDLIKEGKIYATGAANTYNAGYWAMQMLYTAANGLDNPIGDWKEAGRSPLPQYVNSGTDVVTAENADYYYLD